MKKIHIISSMTLCLVIVTASGCQIAQEKPVRSDALYQVSLLNGLMLGDYDGSVSVGALQRLGDTGIGTFNELDGELIMIGGKTYKAKSDGSVELQPDSETVPFAIVTFFDNDIVSRNLADLKDIEALKKTLDQVIVEEKGDFNRFYIASIEGTFSSVHVRSVPSQTKPYKPLAEITKTQTEFNYENVEGTIIALRCPDYVSGINLPGWHLHFISKDRTKGGHLLDADLIGAVLSMDKISEFQLMLPETEEFAKLNLTQNLNSDTNNVESKK